jgi:Zn-dependent M32 family carboxypeptidase
VQTFREFFEDVDEINDIDMICNVVLKDGVHNSFLSIFGYDVEENINCFWLRNTEEFPFDELIQRFFSVLTSTKTKSLKGTLEVLQVMKRLEETVNSFIPLMKSLSAKEEEIEKARLMLTTCQSQIESNTKIDTNFSLETVEQTYRTKVLWEKIECEGRELFDLLEKDFDGIARTMLHYFEIVWFSIRQLKRISRGNPYLTQELYDLLFDVEEKLKRQGYQENIEKLKN